MIDMFGKTDEQLLLHVVRVAAQNKSGIKGRRPAWSRVAGAVHVGSTLAANLCVRAGLDPHTGEEKHD